MSLGKKIAAALTGLVFSLAMVGLAQAAISAQCRANLNACTPAELTEYIAELTATIEALRARLGGTQTTGVPAACVGITFTRDLAEGMSGADVKCLQALLNQSTDTQVAASGPGSPGAETSHFGSLTKAAVIKFQEKNASEILTPIGLTSGTGYVGARTRAKLNSLLTVTPPTLPTPECTTDAQCRTGYRCDTTIGKCVAIPETPECTTDAQCRTGYRCDTTTGKCVAVEVTPEEGYLTFTLSPSPANTTVYRGTENVSVMAFTLKANNSDITVQRVSLKFNKRPWLFVSHISLYEGTNALRGVEATSTAFEEVGVGTDYRLHVSGLNVKIAKGTTKTFTVKVSVPVGTHSTGDVEVSLPINGIRGVDTAGLQQYTPSDDKQKRTFNVATATQGTVEVSLATDSPLEGPAIVSSTQTTEDVVLAKINLKAKHSNINVRKIVLNGNYTDGIGTTIETALPSVKLYDGAMLLKTAAPAGTTITFDLSDSPLAIAKDATKTLTVKADVAKISSNTVTVGASVSIKLVGNVTNVVGEDATYQNANVTGKAEGYKIYFYEKAPSVSLVSQDIKSVEVQTQTGSKSEANWNIKVAITALGGDIYIRKYDATTTSDSGLVAEKIESGIGGGIVFTISSDATFSNNAWHIPIGATKTFTVSGRIPAGGQAGMNGAHITKIRWNTTGDDTGWFLWDWSSIPLVFKTDKIYVSNQ